MNLLSMSTKTNHRCSVEADIPDDMPTDQRSKAPSGTSAAALLAGLPQVSMSARGLRVISVLNKSHHRVPHGAADA